MIDSPIKLLYSIQRALGKLRHAFAFDPTVDGRMAFMRVQVAGSDVLLTARRYTSEAQAAIMTALAEDHEGLRSLFEKESGRAWARLTSGDFQLPAIEAEFQAWKKGFQAAAKRMPF